MYQALQTFHIGMEDGTEVLVKQGKVFPDNHPLIKRDTTGTLFEKLEDDMPVVAKKAEPPKPAPPAPTPADTSTRKAVAK